MSNFLTVHNNCVQIARCFAEVSIVTTEDLRFTFK